jgi:hypothetical protein
MIVVRSIFEELQIFSTDQVANGWRSATFQSAFPIVSSDDPVSNNETASLSYSNLDSAISSISSLFNCVSEISSKPITTPASEIRQAVLVAREIALQFGVHPANLRLVFPAHGECVKIGPEFHDCFNGNMDMGAMYTVDLVTFPGLQKVGDGRMDMESVIEIVPCEIFGEKTRR